MFAATNLCPDTAYLVNKLTQYCSNPSPAHCNSAKCVLQYLNSIKDQVLCLGGKNLCLYAYSDVDFAGDSDDRCSTSRYRIFLGAKAVSWSSRKQSVIILSSTKSKYITLTEVMCKIMWMCHFLKEPDIMYKEPTTIFIDNKGAIASNQKTLYHMKNIEVSITSSKS